MEKNLLLFFFLTKKHFLNVGNLLAVKVPFGNQIDKKKSVNKGRKYACGQIHYNIYIDHFICVVLL